MGISQQIGASSLIKPGVIDTSAQRPASPYEGQVIFQKDTDQMLVWNGTAWVIPNAPAQNPTGLELITTTTCSAGGTATNGVVTIGSTVSTVSVGNVFSSTYDNYEIVMAGGTSSVALISLQFQFAGVTTGLYYGAWVGARYTTGAATGLGVNGATSWTYTGQHLNGNHVMSLKVWGANKTTRKYCSNGFFVAAANGDFGVFTGECLGTTAETGFNIIPSSGTLTGGTIRVYGYRN